MFATKARKITTFKKLSTKFLSVLTSSSHSLLKQQCQLTIRCQANWLNFNCKKQRNYKIWHNSRGDLNKWFEKTLQKPPNSIQFWLNFNFNSNFKFSCLLRKIPKVSKVNRHTQFMTSLGPVRVKQIVVSSFWK